MTCINRSVLLALVLVCVIAAGCAGSSPVADKAGGSDTGRVVWRLAVTGSGVSDDPPVADFARRLAALSHGTIRVKVLSPWGGFAADSEVQVAHAVASGTVELGSIGSRVFDSLGVPSFQALSAPLLIDSYPLEAAVLRSAMPGEMLVSLNRLGVTGLGLLGEELRLPISVHRPLLTPADWRGLSVGTYRSDVQEEAIKGLGATPFVAFGPVRSQALDAHRIQAFELDVRRYMRNGLATKAPYVTANVALWPQFDVLLANPMRLASLTDQQRTWFIQAARAAGRDSVALVSDEEKYVRELCAIGARFADASAADLKAMRTSLTATYAQIEQDPATKAFIERILSLKRSTPPSPILPAGCTGRR